MVIQWNYSLLLKSGQAKEQKVEKLMIAINKINIKGQYKRLKVPCFMFTSLFPINAEILLFINAKKVILKYL